MNPDLNKNIFHSHKISAKVIFIILVAIFILWFVFTVLASNNTARSSKSLSTQTLYPSADYAGRGVGESYAPASPSSVINNAGVAISTDRKVIQSATLSIVVKKAKEAIDEIKNIAKKSNGYVEHANIYETGDNRVAGNITIRVPSKNLETALAEVKGTAIKVSRENLNAQDVTKQFVDLEARLRNFKAQEEQYLLILKRAEKIADILLATQSLSSVRENIERLQAEMNYLSAQVDMSSISVDLTAEADVKIFGVVWNPMQEIRHALNDLVGALIGFSNSVIAFVFFLPVLALWLLVVMLGGWVILKGAKKLKGYLSTHI